MSIAVRTSLILLLTVTVVVPGVTAHSFVEHLRGLPGGIRVSALWHPASLLLLALTVLATMPLLRLGIAGGRALRASHRFASIAAGGHERHLEDISYVRIPGVQVSLFAAGFLQGRIYVTAGAEYALQAPQLRAALLHELAHLRGHHPQWLALTVVLRYAYQPLPGAVAYFDAVRLDAERQADRSALGAGTRRADLFEAIALASAGASARNARHELTALGGVGVEQRLRWIAEDEPPARHPIPVARAAVLAVAPWTLPLTAHAFLWTGVISGVTSHHVM